ncbi:MAG: tRNA (5-methylaminomethyl-2-thiouridine)(34)-methyltransferase MnmD [Nonlabens sp.]
MKREIMITGDGSKTIHMPDLNEQYHSKHGALQEALHVFIETGLGYYLGLNPLKSSINVMEFGFGTGLNALLTARHESAVKINYTAVEAFPINQEEMEAMGYGTFLDAAELFRKLHDCEWESWNSITNNFDLLKNQKAFEKIQGLGDQDLIYYDAFGPRTQPELWTQELFEICYSCLKSDGVLTTYCAQGQARRNMVAAGFTVERLPGPPGKREMLRATKS